MSDTDKLLMITGSESFSSTPLKCQTRALEKQTAESFFFYFPETESHAAEDLCVIFYFMQTFPPYSSSTDGYLKKSHSDLQAQKKTLYTLWTAIVSYSSELLALAGWFSC